MRLKILIRENFLYGKKIGIKSHRQILQGNVAPHHIRERKGSTRGVAQKCETHELSPFAPKFAERTQDGTLHQENQARGVAWDLVKSVTTRSRIQKKATFYFRIQAGKTKEMIAALAPTLKTTKEREFVVDSGASIHMLSKKDLRSDEMDTSRRSRIPATVVRPNGEVQTSEEAQVYVHELDHFVHVQLLEDTFAVLSLGHG